MCYLSPFLVKSWICVDQKRSTNTQNYEEENDKRVKKNTLKKKYKRRIEEINVAKLLSSEKKNKNIKNRSMIYFTFKSYDYKHKK
jgi:hypothetical protein